MRYVLSCDDMKHVVYEKFVRCCGRTRGGQANISYCVIDLINILFLFFCILVLLFLFIGEILVVFRCVLTVDVRLLLFTIFSACSVKVEDCCFTFVFVSIYVIACLCRRSLMHEYLTVKRNVVSWQNC